MAPEYEAAAQVLKEQHEPPIPFAKVDGTVETDLAQEYEVTGYPTLKIFRKGMPYEYKGPRTRQGIYKIFSHCKFKNTQHLCNCLYTFE